MAMRWMRGRASERERWREGRRDLSLYRCGSTHTASLPLARDYYHYHYYYYHYHYYYRRRRRRRRGAQSGNSGSL